MKLYILISIFVTVVGCRNLDKRNVEKPKELPISQLITELEESKCVETKYVGIEGRPSETYAVYEKLLEAAPDSLWWNLTYSKSGVMKFDAFQALSRKRDPRLVEIINRLKNDTSSIRYRSADVEIPGTVGFFVRHASDFDSVNRIVK
jgi:hypothetical protein